MSSNNNQPSPEIRNHDMLALRSFITAQDHKHAYTAAASSPSSSHFLLLDFSHSNLDQRHIEIKLERNEYLLENMQQSIYQKTGTSPSNQELYIYQGNQLLAGPIESLADCWSILQSGMRIHCIDSNPFSISRGGSLENTQLVPKFRLTDDQYNAKPKTLRAWAKQQQVDNPKFTLGQVQTYNKASVANCIVGERCQVMPGKRRGIVAWTGMFHDGDHTYFVGVHLDEPIGQNDGSHKGHVYFETRGPGYGCFARGQNVQCGPQFVERDIMDQDDESDDDDDKDDANNEDEI
jgi:tubulin-folding cofactor B